MANDFLVPDEIPVYGFAEYERRKRFWDEFAEFALNEEQAERFRLYGRMGIAIPEQAWEQLQSLKQERATVMATKREGVPCYDKAELDEPIFVLRAQDVCAADTVDDWVRRATECGVHPAKCEEARECARKMREWPNRRVPT